MSAQTLRLLCILLDPRVTWKPLGILRELRRRGVRRVPDSVLAELGGGLRKNQALRFVRHWLDGERLSWHRGQWVLNSFIPPFPGRAFNRMFENLLSGRHLSPVSAFLAVTEACPCRCWHCSLRGRRSGALSTSQWLAVIRDLHGLGVSIVGFTGGEPLTRDDLPELVTAASGGGAATIVFTSGLPADTGGLRRLRHAGLWGLCVSLDHPSPEEHDRLRGCPGAYAGALETLRQARRCGFYTMVSSVATRPFIEQRLYEGIRDLARREGVDEYRLVEPMPCGRLTEPGAETLLAPDHAMALRRFHVETNRRGRLPKVCAFNQVESPEVFGCGAGTQHLYIDPAGEVCPCDFTPLSFGNVTQVALAEAWQRMNRAMGNNPRSHCFVRKHHALVAKHAGEEYPLSPPTSESLCRQAGPEPLPGYFAMITGAGQGAPGAGDGGSP